MVRSTTYTKHKNAVEKIQKRQNNAQENTQKTNISTFYTRVENLINITFPNDEIQRLEQRPKIQPTLQTQRLDKIPSKWSKHCNKRSRRKSKKCARNI